jgi:hypothetical protein
MICSAAQPAAQPAAAALAPAREPGFWRAFVVAGGRVTARTIPRGAAGRLEIQACLAAATAAEPSLAPEDAADVLVVALGARGDLDPPARTDGFTGVVEQVDQYTLYRSAMCVQQRQRL